MAFALKPTKPGGAVQVKILEILYFPLPVLRAQLVNHEHCGKSTDRSRTTQNTRNMFAML